MLARIMFNKACKTFGLEHSVTIAVGRVLDAFRTGIINCHTADVITHNIYKQASKQEV